MSSRFVWCRHFDGAGGMPPERREPDNASPALPSGKETGGLAGPEPAYTEYAFQEEDRSDEPSPDEDERGEQTPAVPERVFGPEQPVGPISPTAPAPRSPRRRGMEIAGLVLTVIVVFGIVAGIVNLSGHFGVSNFQPGHPTTAFQPAHCPFKLGAGIVEGKQVRCGYVTVPENRDAHNSHKIKLAVAIFKSKRFMTSVDPNPVLRLDGGPGGASLERGSRITSANYNSRVFNHDLIMFDQRGTGYSTPSLECPELNTSTASNSQRTQEQAMRACHDRLVASGIDLNGYNTLQNAADVADVIRALGYQQMTVYGVSYGTRLALTVMRLHPEVVRAAVLDSVYPTNHNRTDLPADAQHVFNVFFQGCAKDPGCNAKYPNLQSVFYKLVDQLNAHPLTITATDPSNGKKQTVTYTGDDLVSELFGALYDTSAIPLLPQAIYQMKEKAHGGTQNLPLLSGVSGFGHTFSPGLFYSAECSEDWAFRTQQDITKSLQGITPQIAQAFGKAERLEYNVCQFWHVKPTPASQKQPVVSDIPTLVLSGEYDPITPPSNGQETAKRLSHSYYFVFPGQGHGQEYSSPCSNLIISEFEDNPYQRPSDACMSLMTPPLFQ